MKASLDEFERVVTVLSQAIRPGQYDEVPEQQVIAFLEQSVGDREGALETWEDVAPDLRKPIVRDGRVFEWNLFRRVVCISKLPDGDELERIAELYRRSAPEEVERRIRVLTGPQFERFLGELLRQMPNFRGIHVTQVSRDGGIDFRGRYAPDLGSPEWPLLGQAKQTAAPVAVREARDFIGALDTSGEVKVFGLFVSTSGFTDPAREALHKSRYPILLWDLDDVRKRIFEVSMGLRRVELTLDLVDETFWDELVGRTASG